MKIFKILLLSIFLFTIGTLSVNAGSVTVYIEPTGTLTASNCTIAVNASSCNTNLVWDTVNPVGTSAVTTPTNITVKSANSSTGTPYSVYSGSRMFYLYNDGVELSSTKATASCNTSISYWDSSSNSCVAGLLPPPPVPGSEPELDLMVTRNGVELNPTEKIPYNGKALVEWTSSFTQSCSCTSLDVKTGAELSCGNTLNGKYETPSLKRDTQYTVSCLGNNGNYISKDATILVDKINTNYTEN